MGRTRLPIAIAAVGVLGVVRAIEVLVGLHTRTGALTVSTTLVVVVGLVLSRSDRVPIVNRRANSIDRRQVLVVGGLGVLAVQAAAHGLATGWVTALGHDPAVRLTAVNPATKSTAPGQVWTYLVFGVVLAAVGEELLFRGVLLGAASRRLSFWPANLVQGALFGAWHLVWPLAVVLADATTVVSVPVYAVGFVAVTGTIGAVYGVFARATGTLWTAVLAHLLHNLTAVVLHVPAPDGANPGAVISAVLVAGYVTLAWRVWARWNAGT